jgi:hypothetical protein
MRNRAVAVTSTLFWEVVRLGRRVRRTKAIVQAGPQCPALALQTRVQGDVKIDAILDEQGQVIDMKVLQQTEF